MYSKSSLLPFNERSVKYSNELRHKVVSKEEKHLTICGSVNLFGKLLYINLKPRLHLKSLINYLLIKALCEEKGHFIPPFLFTFQWQYKRKIPKSPCK